MPTPRLPWGVMTTLLLIFLTNNQCVSAFRVRASTSESSHSRLPGGRRASGVRGPRSLLPLGSDKLVVAPKHDASPATTPANVSLVAQCGPMPKHRDELNRMLLPSILGFWDERIGNLVLLFDKEIPQAQVDGILEPQFAVPPFSSAIATARNQFFVDLAVSAEVIGLIDTDAALVDVITPDDIWDSKGLIRVTQTTCHRWNFQKAVLVALRLGGGSVCIDGMSAFPVSPCGSTAPPSRARASTS
mmetsp:Transcript_34099/g.74573  ORF Transcript_34099/g.74573 Transcript_34099/m.74573 type:complete len:245 (-) Transcript_34099:162-896(-)